MLKWDEKSVADAMILDWDEFRGKYPQFCSFDAWRRKRYDVEKVRLPLNQAAAYGVPKAQPPKIEPIMRITDPNVLYVCDIHAPLHSEEYLNRSIAVGKKLGINQVIIGGDTFNFSNLSRHGHNDAETDLDTDAEIGGQIIEAYLKSFSRVYLFRGNHDFWFGRKLDANWSMERMVKGALGNGGVPIDRKTNEPRLRISSREFMYLGDNWLFGHPRQYSGQGGRVPAKIAQAVHRNVVGSHNHVFGIQQSTCGKYVGIDPGCMTEGRYHSYLENEMPGQFSSWTVGFLVIKNDKPIMFNDFMTDWSAYGY